MTKYVVMKQTNSREEEKLHTINRSTARNTKITYPPDGFNQLITSIIT